MENDVLPEEREHVASAITGLWQSHSWQGEKKAVDFYVLKGVLEGLFEALGVTDQVGYTPSRMWRTCTQAGLQKFS